MAGEERHGLEAWAWQLGMGLRHGLEDGLGLRHGLEAWGREGWLGLRHGREGWPGLSNGKKRYSVGLEKHFKKVFQSMPPAFVGIFFLALSTISLFPIA